MSLASFASRVLPRPALLLLVFCPAPLVTGGCEPCEEAACEDEWRLSIERPARAAFQPGLQLEVTADGERVVCTFAAPDAEGRSVGTCNGQRLEAVLRERLSCPDPTTMAGSPQQCQRTGEQTLDLRLPQTPAQIDVRVREGGAWQERRFTPDYRTVFPNGEACAPSCRQATAEAWTLS